MTRHTDSDTALEPREAVALYLKDREHERTEQSLQSHGYRLERFLKFCDREGIEDMADVTARTVHDYKTARDSTPSNPLQSTDNLPPSEYS